MEEVALSLNEEALKVGERGMALCVTGEAIAYWQFPVSDAANTDWAMM